MPIAHIHSYLVHPEKGSDEPMPIKGTAVEGRDTGLLRMLENVFDEAPKECRFDIAFNAAADGAQQNDCRDLLVAYLANPTVGSGRPLASRLQAVTTRRSGLGLLFLIAGRVSAGQRVVVSRFPADHGILAEEGGGSLSVRFIERVFMKSATAYKSAVYEGRSLATGFWIGKAIDKQIGPGLTIANYWIQDFLASDFATTGERGTRRLALALKEVVNGTSPVAVKEEIGAVLRLVGGLDGRVVSPHGLLARLGVSDESVGAVRVQIGDSLFEREFPFVYEEFRRHIQYRTVEMDTGALLVAEAGRFSEVFDRTEAADGVTFSTTGQIVGEKLKKRK